MDSNHRPLPCQFFTQQPKTLCLLCFPESQTPKNTQKIDGFGDELVTSCRVYFEEEFVLHVRGFQPQKFSEEFPEKNN